MDAKTQMLLAILGLGLSIAGLITLTLDWLEDKIRDHVNTPPSDLEG